MRHSLLSKFQGALLGAALGNLMGIQSRQALVTGKSRAGLRVHLTTDAPDFPSLSQVPQLTFPDIGGRLALLCTRSLIRCQGLDLSDWHRSWGELSGLPSNRDRRLGETQQPPLDGDPPHLETPDPSVGRFESFQPDLLAIVKLFSGIHPIELAIAALPITLLFHENKLKLQEVVESLVATWTTLKLYSGNPEDLTAGILAIGYGIAQACKEKLDPSTLIHKITAYLEVDTSLAALLLQVQILLDRGASLETATIHLRRSATPPLDRQRSGESRLEASTNAALVPLIPICLAFYCFLSHPEDFKLAVVRAARSGWEPNLTCALTGALSGAYNGRGGCPPEWNFITKAVPSTALQSESRLWGVSADPEILELAAHLLSVWSGVYHSIGSPDLEILSPIVAAPYAIGRQRLQ